MQYVEITIKYSDGNDTITCSERVSLLEIKNNNSNLLQKAFDKSLNIIKENISELKCALNSTEILDVTTDKVILSGGSYDKLCVKVATHIRTISMPLQKAPDGEIVYRYKGNTYNGMRVFEYV